MVNLSNMAEEAVLLIVLTVGNWSLGGVALARVCDFLERLSEARGLRVVWLPFSFDACCLMVILCNTVIPGIQEALRRCSVHFAWIRHQECGTFS